MRLADYLWKRIFELTGTRHCFTLAGGGIMHLIDALEKSPITPVYMLDERSAAIAADMYGRRNGTPGLLLVTTGPGITNAITGVMGAYLDSSPMIVVSGQVNDQKARRHGDRQKGIQEVNALDLAGEYTNFRSDVLDTIAFDTVIDLSIAYMGRHRPGPVWISIPLNIQTSEVTCKE
jgi:acetolactate synthase I/II/III large subunit